MREVAADVRLRDVPVAQVAADRVPIALAGIAVPASAAGMEMNGGPLRHLQPRDLRVAGAGAVGELDLDRVRPGLSAAFEAPGSVLRALHGRRQPGVLEHVEREVEPQAAALAARAARVLGELDAV